MFRVFTIALFSLALLPAAVPPHTHASVRLGASRAAVDSTAGAGALPLTSGQAWTASSSADWLTVSPASGTGDQTLTYTFTANSSSAARIATITVNGRSFSLTQVSATGAFTPWGDSRILAGEATAADALRLRGPRGVAADGNGNLYIADSANNLVRKLTAANGTLTSITAAEWNNPSAVAVDFSGNLFVADAGNSRILKIDPATGLSTPVASDVESVNSLALDPSGAIYFTAARGIRRLDLSSGLITSLALDLDHPSAVAADASGNLFIADPANHRVSKLDTATGLLTTVAADLSTPAGLAVAPSGDLYIADSATHSVFLLAASGELQPVPTGDSPLNGPTGLALDGSGNLFIADTNNQRLLFVDRATPPAATATRSPAIIGNVPLLVSASPSTPSATTQVFNFTARDLDGYSNLSRFYFLINPTPNVTTNSCHGFYDRATDAVYLYDDSLSNLSSLTNSQCTVNAFSKAFSGTDFTLTLTLTRKTSTPAKLYLWITDADSNGTGWLQVAAWSSVPTLLSSSPSTVTASQQTFTITARDPDGASNLNRIYFLLNPTSDIPQNTCHGFYDRAQNAVFLYNDNLTSLASLTNSQCAVNGFAATPSGTDLTLTLTLTKTTAPVANLYVWITDNDGNGTGWISIATSGTAAQNHPPSLVSAVPATVTASTQLISITARDPEGYANINRIYFLLNPTPDIPQNTCHGLYDRALNAVFLYDDTLTNVSSLSNSQCSVQGFSTAFGGTDFILNLTLTKKTASAANFYVWITDNDANGTGWVAAATWPGAVTPISIVSTTPSAATAPQQQFTITGRSGAGFTNLNRLYFLVNSSTAIPANTCHGFYDRALNAIYLYNDGLSALLGPLTPGANSQIQNSQCAVDGATSALVATSGTDLTLRLGLVRKVPTTDQTLYLWLTDNQTNGTGWVAAATWPASASVNQAPTFISASPVFANGTAQTFQFTVRDPDGANNLDKIYFLIHTSPTPAVGSCHGYYQRSTNQLYLYDDTLTILNGPLTAGSGGLLQNSQCVIDGSISSTFNPSSTDLTLQIGLRRKGTFATSSQTIFLWTTDIANAGTGWIAVGVWNP